MIDPYEILNVSPNATEQQIKNAYRQLAKRYHPDVSKEANASEKFIAITEAYETILNGTTEFAELYETFSSPTVDTRETDRQERARQYSQMKYDEFVRNNTAFKQKWYYFPVKIMSYSIVYLMYLFGIFIIVVPLFFWIYSSFQDSAFVPLFTAMFGGLWIRMTGVLKKEIAPFFDDHNMKYAS